MIDLGAAYELSQLDLCNTHNAQYNDRGTGNFTIKGANAVTDLGGGNFNISGPTTTLVTNTLAAQTGDPIADQAFSVTDTGSYRYIRFDALSAAAGNGNPCCPAPNPVAYGLNEIRFSGVPVPEPASLALFVGAVGLLAVAHRRRRA